MHFRNRGGSVQIVRTRYNPQTKRGDTQVVGRLDRLRMQIDDTLRAGLSEDELAEVQAYIERHGHAVRIDLDHAAAHFTQTMDQVIDWLQVIDADEAEAFAVGIERPFGRLRRQMAKLSPKPAGRRRRPAPGTAQAGRK